MSDKLENFIRNNREKFDQQTPGSDVWNNISAGLAQQAAAGAAASGTAATTATKGGLAKIAMAWKIAAGAIATLAAGTIIYFAATSNGDGKSPEKSEVAMAAPDTDDDSHKVEFIETASPLVNPPLPAADVPYYTFQVNAKKGGEWKAPNGTTITVPKNAFVDENGKPVKGAVDIKYREFHDAADIILSGIPMTYDNNGKIEDFQTAGMLEILGYQDDKPVYVAEGKEIAMSTASFTGEDDYNFYYLDPEKGGWVDIGRAEVSQNKDKEKGLRLLPKLPKKPVKPNKGVPGVEMDNELSFAVDYKKYPELKPFKKVRWEAADAAFMQNNQWIFTKVWNEADLKEVDSETMEYQIVLKNRNRNFKINVKPVLEGADYEKAMAKFRKKTEKFELLKKQREEEKERLYAQADVLRSFAVTGFGIYNHDRFLGMPAATLDNIEVEFPDNVFMDPEKTLLYQIGGNNRAVITHEGTKIWKLRFPTRENNFLVAILPGSKLGLFTDKDFEKALLLQEQGATKVPVKMRLIDKEIRNATDLRLALGV